MSEDWDREDAPSTEDVPFAGCCGDEWCSGLCDDVEVDE